MGDENADIYFKKELTRVIGKANTLELFMPHQRVDRVGAGDPGHSRQRFHHVAPKDVKDVHSCAHSTQALSPRVDG